MNDNKSEFSGCLAHGPGCRVQLCEMGVVHVTFGGMTAHISQPKFEAFCDTLVAALCQLHIKRSVQSGSAPTLI